MSVPGSPSPGVKATAWEPRPCPLGPSTAFTVRRRASFCRETHLGHLSSAACFNDLVPSRCHVCPLCAFGMSLPRVELWVCRFCFCGRGFRGQLRGRLCSCCKGAQWSDRYSRIMRLFFFFCLLVRFPLEAGFPGLGVCFLEVWVPRGHCARGSPGPRASHHQPVLKDPWPSISRAHSGHIPCPPPSWRSIYKGFRSHRIPTPARLGNRALSPSSAGS